MAETLLLCGRSLEVLKLIEELENKPTTESETTFGATYLKALAYYNLGQKNIAIQMLEALAAVVPSFRSTEALLHEWKTS